MSAPGSAGSLGKFQSLRLLSVVRKRPLGSVLYPLRPSSTFLYFASIPCLPIRSPCRMVVFLFLRLFKRFSDLESISRK